MINQEEIRLPNACRLESLKVADFLRDGFWKENLLLHKLIMWSIFSIPGRLFPGSSGSGDIHFNGLSHRFRHFVKKECRKSHFQASIEGIPSSLAFLLMSCS